MWDSSMVALVAPYGMCEFWWIQQVGKGLHDGGFISTVRAQQR